MIWLCSSMRKLEWSSGLSIGVPEIDSQHQRLVQLANNLVAAIQTNIAEDILETLFKELREYTLFHFQDEELYMHTIGYPEAASHAEQHEELKRQVKEYQQSILQKETISPEEVLKFLKDWLVDHIIYEDMKISRFLANQPQK